MNELHATHLYAAVMRGQMITVKDAEGRDCSLFRNSAYSFVMVKQGGGSHELDVGNTSKERLAAHWAGFTGQPLPAAPAPAPVEPSKLVAGDQMTYFRNQGDRDALVLAVDGDKALVAYEMPSGVTYLNIVAADGSDEAGAYRAVSPKGLSKRWREAVLWQSGQDVMVNVRRCGKVQAQRLLGPVPMSTCDYD